MIGKNVSSLKAIVDGSKDHPEVMTTLFRATYKKYGLLKWTEVLEIRDINRILIESGFRYYNCPDDGLPCIGDVITEDKWSLDNVKCMIRNGYDVNACADNESRPRLTGNVKTRTDPPFFIALRYDRFDIVKVLLLNGAQPLNRNMFYYRYLVEANARARVFYLLLTCYTPLSVPCGETSLLQFLLGRAIPSHLKPSCKDLFLLLLDRIDTFCDEDRKVLMNYYRHSLLPDEEMLQKINEIFFEPRRLQDICRNQLHRCFAYCFKNYIDFLSDQGCPGSILGFLQFNELLEKYFDKKDIERLKKEF